MKTCPQCHLMLEQAEWSGAPLWACRTCGGCWLQSEAVELALATDRGRLAELNAHYPGQASAGMFEGLPRYCPDCHTARLERKGHAALATVEPLTCDNCGGVWLEASERQALVPRAGDRAEPQEPEASAAESTVPVEMQSETGPAQPDPALELSAIAEPEEPLPSPVAQPVTEACSPSVGTPDVLESVAEESAEPEIVSREEETAAVLEELTATGDWCCPRCLTIYEVEEGATDESCDDCGVLLVQADYVINCPECGRENSFANEVCVQCGTPLRTEARLAELYPSAPWVGRTGTDTTPRPLDEPTQAVGPPVASIRYSSRWCPLCRRAFTTSESLCYACNVGLVEGSYRVLCLSCGSECAIGAEECWQCHDPLHPPADTMAAPGRPAARLPRDFEQTTRAGKTPQNAGSCGGSVLCLLAATLFLFACLIGRT